MSDIKKIVNKYGIYIPIVLCIVTGILAIFFRVPTLDDDLYLYETSILTNTIKQGDWFGQYGVGIHGFIFKLPVAIAFLFTQPSLIVATLWNICIAVASLFMFYKVLQKLLKDNSFALIGTLLLLTNFQFMLNLPTYMREIPVLFALILFLYTIIKYGFGFISGLALLLVFDAKESVFFMIAVGVLLGIGINSYRKRDLKNTITVFVKNSIKIFLPSFVYILIMLFTSIVPLNTTIFTVIPGVTEGGVEYQLKHFETTAATDSVVRLESPEAKTTDSLLDIQNTEDSQFWDIVHVILSYVGKILYPRTFSFLSIPLFIIISAFSSSIVLFKEKLKDKDSVFITLSAILWSYLGVYIFRLSFDRYLFPITPVVIYFFLLFLTQVRRKNKTFLIITLIGGVLSIISLLFEADYVIIKLLLNLGIFIPMLFYALFNGRKLLLQKIIPLFISFLCLAVSIFYFYKEGQYYRSTTWGKEYEVHTAISYFDPNEKILINDIGWDMLLNVYRGDLYSNPEWKWELKSWVPRKNDLKAYGKINTFVMNAENMLNEKEFIEDEGIEKVVLVVSNLKNTIFPYQDKLIEYKSSDWLRLEKVVNLKNKDMYIFKVLE